MVFCPFPLFFTPDKNMKTQQIPFSKKKNQKNQYSNSHIQRDLYKLPANLLPSCDHWALNRSLIKPVSVLVRASITLAFRREAE